jgi:geranylgeranyl reductase family protein
VTAQNVDLSASRGQADDAVVIVGAGPAGATAARRLAVAGRRVVLLDKARFPRNKPCGGGISMRALRRFPYLAPALSRISTHAVSRLYLEGPARESTLIESSEPAALMIRRVEFDALLVALAVEAGAELAGGVDIVQARAEGTRTILVARDGRTFSARTVIAADGVHSVVARRLGLNAGWHPTAVALDMMEETPRTELRDVDPSTLWVTYGYAPASASSNASTAAAEGYAYIFPKRDHVNIGIGYVLAYYRREVDAAPYDLQRAFVDRLRADGIVVGRSARRNFTPFLIPVGGPLARPGRGRVLLAGDAGGFVNGFTAEGIYYAMVSGELAAATVAEHGDAVEDLARPYRRAVDAEVGAELRDSILLQRYLFKDRRRIARVVRSARGARATRLVLDLAVGRRSYREVRRRILLNSPLLAVRMLFERFNGNLHSAI